ncbi:MAG TPA: riboflavin synthase [Gemmatimonadaceae bacterium]|nr:riboflavin synthase [Gemmatimonadaceae bacterium]
MFTGLIEEVGVIESIDKTDAGVELRIASTFTEVEPGESIAVSGPCLTVRTCGPGWFTVAAMVMTISRTTIGEWKRGKRVNLERSVRGDQRLGGHIVQGHVDGVGHIEGTEKLPDTLLMNVGLPAGLSQTLVLHGSVALDGVSLTVNALDGDKLQVALIDYTLHHTALQDLRQGDRVNVETDVVGKYIQRLAAPYLKT